MPELVFETPAVYLTVLWRVITVMIVLQIATMIMGKRSVGELPIVDFIIVITIGAVAGADLADHEIPHGPTVFAIMLLALIQWGVTSIKTASPSMRRALNFEPTVVIYDGKLLEQNIRGIRYSVSEILTLLREKEIFDLREVAHAVVEPNGRLSVRRKAGHETVRRQDLEMAPATATLPMPLIVEGQFIQEGLKALGRTEGALRADLAEQQLKPEDVYLYLEDEGGRRYVSVGEAGGKVPELLH